MALSVRDSPANARVLWVVRFEGKNAKHEIHLDLPRLDTYHGNDTLIEFTWPAAIGFQRPEVEIEGRALTDGKLRADVLPKIGAKFRLRASTLKKVCKAIGESIDSSLHTVVRFEQTSCVTKGFEEVRVARFRIGLRRVPSEVRLELHLPRQSFAVRWFGQFVALIFRKQISYQAWVQEWYPRRDDPYAAIFEADKNLVRGEVVFRVPKESAREFPQVDIVYRTPLAVALHVVGGSVRGFVIGVAASLMAAAIFFFFVGAVR